MKSKRFISIVATMALAISMFTVMASAAYSDISVSGNRNSTSGWGRAKCEASGTTATYVVVSVFNGGTSNSYRVDYLTDSHKTYGYVAFDGTPNTAIKVSSSAKTNGTYYTGPSKWY